MFFAKGYGTVLILLGFLLAGTAFSQISPGDLAKVHSHLEGMSNCTKCHLLGKKVSNDKCLECHSELKSRIIQQKGYHASAGVRGKECVGCHSDHHGVNFQIIRFAKEKFNHSLTGYELTGAHVKKQCPDCHKASFIRDPKIRSKKFTYLGIDPACMTCHPDYHRQDLPKNCGECHGTDAFKPAAKFDHARARFQLAGMHQQVPCAGCHPSSDRDGKKNQRFRGLQFSNCLSCHKDPHAGKLGQNCTQCHSESSFHAIKGNGGFDHSKTSFPLEGRHKSVACNSCHKTKGIATLKHASCTDCHADYHKGQLSRAGSSPDCSKCHTVQGFQAFRFGIEDHATAAFQLKGAHAAIPCVACHTGKNGATDTTWAFRGIGLACADCHEDVHGQAISDPFKTGGCTNCHTETRWNLVTFDHNRTRFELAGAHGSVSCRTCHFRQKGSGPVRQQFAGLSTACTGCHYDVHVQQFERDGVTDCTRCHDHVHFKPVSRFDHSKTLFPLDGKHAKVPCAKCHKSVEQNGLTFVLYKIKEFKCENCHH